MSSHSPVGVSFLRCFCTCWGMVGVMAGAFVSADDMPVKTAEVYTEWPFDAQEAAKRQDNTAKAVGISNAVARDIRSRRAFLIMYAPSGPLRMSGTAVCEMGPPHAVVYWPLRRDA